MQTIHEISHTKNKNSKIKLVNNKYAEMIQIDDNFFLKNNPQSSAANMQDYFSAQLTPSSKLFESQLMQP